MSSELNQEMLNELLQQQNTLAEKKDLHLHNIAANTKSLLTVIFALLYFSAISSLLLSILSNNGILFVTALIYLIFIAIINLATVGSNIIILIVKTLYPLCPLENFTIKI